VALDRERKWAFTPKMHVGDKVVGGDIIGTVQETQHSEHRILVQPLVSGTIQSIAGAGEYTIDQVIATLDNGKELKMFHTWPVKRPRPVAKRLGSNELFMTSQRVLDFLFPISLGGSAIVPGGFGAGKTVVEQSLSKFCNADIIIYV